MSWTSWAKKPKGQRASIEGVGGQPPEPTPEQADWDRTDAQVRLATARAEEERLELIRKRVKEEEEQEFTARREAHTEKLRGVALKRLEDEAEKRKRGFKQEERENRRKNFREGLKSVKELAGAPVETFQSATGTTGKVSRVPIGFKKDPGRQGMRDLVNPNLSKLREAGRLGGGRGSPMPGPGGGSLDLLKHPGNPLVHPWMRNRGPVVVAATEMPNLGPGEELIEEYPGPVKYGRELVTGVFIVRGRSGNFKFVKEGRPTISIGKDIDKADIVAAKGVK